MSFQTIDEIRESLKQGVSVRELYAAWEQRRPIRESEKREAVIESSSGTKQIPWIQESLILARLFTMRALEREEFLLVCDAAREVFRHWTEALPENATNLVHVRLNYATALTQLGFTRAAREALQPYTDE